MSAASCSPCFLPESHAIHGHPSLHAMQAEARRPPTDAELDAIIKRSTSRAEAAAAAEAADKKAGASGVCAGRGSGGWALLIGTDV